MNKVEQIRAEVERQIKEWRFYSSTEAKYRFETYTELLDYIDSLDDKCDGCNNVKGCVTCKDGSEWAHYEEPVSNDLGEYINELSKQFPDVSFAKLSRIAVRVAKWQKEQMMKDAVEK